MTRSRKDWTRRHILGAAGAFALVPLLAKAAFAAHDNFSEEDIQDLDRLSAYLNALTTVQGKFTQIDQWGRQRDGLLYLQRPGRLRFEYLTPKPDLTILSDGAWLYIQNNALKTTTHYELLKTPFAILVKDKIDLAAEENIVKVGREPGMVYVTARDDKGLLQGEITLNFSDPGIELRNWVMKDAQGTVVQVSIRDLRERVKLNPSLFVAENKPAQGFKKQ
jgi:outer membrane lipoprotein-sorting protein